METKNWRGSQIQPGHFSGTKSLHQHGFDDGSPHCVQLGRRVQAVLREEVRAQFTPRIEHWSSDVDVLSAILRLDVLPDHLVRRLHFRPLVPAQFGRLDGHHIDPGFRQLLVNDMDELLGVVRNHFGRPGRSLRQIVVTLVNDDSARMVGDDNSLRVFVEVGKLRSAKPAIDDIQRLQVMPKPSPSDNARRAREYDSSLLRRLHLVGIFKFANCQFPVLGSSLGRYRTHIREFVDTNPQQRHGHQPQYRSSYQAAHGFGHVR